MTNSLLRIITIIALVTALNATEAPATSNEYGAAAPLLSDFTIQVRVSGGGTYDYCIMGMNANAADGFDNVYDVFSPGWNMNNTFISCMFPHPEWNTVKTEFRGDIRSLKQADTWLSVISTNLPAGTPLTLEILPMDTALPDHVVITVTDLATGLPVDLKAGPYLFPAAGPGTITNLTLGALQVQPDSAGGTNGKEKDEKDNDLRKKKKHDKKWRSENDDEQDRKDD